MATIEDKYILDIAQYVQSIQKIIDKSAKAASETEKVNKKQKELEKQMAKTRYGAESLAKGVASLVSSYIGFLSIKGLVQMSDTFAAINARLGNMGLRLENVKDMQDAIYKSAQRSRASYTDTAGLVASLGTLAGNAFSSFEELVAFSEQINKNIALSGASGAEASGAIRQLMQGLASGTLRGDELNSVLEQTPLIAKRIEEYMGLLPGELREVAAEGKITAQVVKNAMFATAEETNAAFANVPMTWAQVWTEIQNTTLIAVQPILNTINKIANNIDGIKEAFDNLLPAIEGATTAFGIMTTAIWVQHGGWAALIANVATFFATLNAGLISTGIGAIAVAIGTVIALIVKWRQEAGFWSIMWLQACDWVQTEVEELILVWKKFVLVVKSLAIEAVSMFLVFVQDITAPILDLLNMIPGVDIARNWAINLEAKGLDEIKKSQEELEEFERGIDKKQKERYYNIADERRKLWRDKEGDGTEGDGIGDIPFEPYTPDGVKQNIKGISSDTKAIKKAVEMSSEELTMLVDMASQRYVNNINLETRAPVINVTGQNTGDNEADARAFAEKLKWVLLDQQSNSGNVPIALPI